jgi:hypothetical protein
VGGGPGWSDTIYEVRRARLGARARARRGAEEGGRRFSRE